MNNTYSNRFCVYVFVFEQLSKTLYLAEDDSVERLVKGDFNLHVLLAAHDLEVGDVCHFSRSFRLPQFEAVEAALS